MIISDLKTILEDSGCTLVIYEQAELANLKLDQSKHTDIIGVVIEPDTIRLEVKANAIMEHYPPHIIEVLQMVVLEDDANNNETKLQQCLDICKEIIIRLIATGDFKKIESINCTKIKERKYDANVIGWSLPLDLTRLLNETRDPCLRQGEEE